jgi:hypothetical protein
MYFYKLDKLHDIKISDFRITKRNVGYGEEKDGEFFGLEYYSITTNKQSYLFDFLPEKYRKYFGICLMTANTSLNPHIDSDTKATINFYIETSDCITQFYDIVNDKKVKLENQTDGCIYEGKDLIKKDFFIAKNSEIYLLDVTKPHAVVAESLDKINRTTICLQTNHLSFDEVLKILT